VISVAATTTSDTKAGFSTFGETVDISAPGTSIYTTDVQNQYGTTQGTSFSCPIVAGAAALLRAHYPDFDQAQIAHLLYRGADDIYFNNPNFIGQLGAGRLNIVNSLTTQSSALQVSTLEAKDAEGRIPTAGEEGILVMEVINQLFPSNENAQLTIYPLDSGVVLSQQEFTLGVIQQKETKVFDPLATFIVPDTIGLFSSLSFAVTITDTAFNYRDSSVFEVVVNPAETPLKALPYLLSDGGDFETNPDDFIAYRLLGDLNLWERGAPTNTLRTVNSGTNVWKTDLDADLVKEDYNCALQTPTYDFSDVSKEYVLSFYKSMESEFCNAPAAVMMEYTIDGQNWKRLGAFGDVKGTN
jgi:hypothetical protein